MSASRWRRAMQGGFQQPALQLPARSQPAGSSPASAGGVETDPYAESNAPRWLKFLWRHLSARHVLIFLFLLAYPFVATPFFTFQVAAQSLVLGLIALSLTFLGGYGGIVSLAQMSVAGVAGYSIAIFGVSSTPISLGWPWWVAVLVALFIACACATVVGWLSVRTEGIYTIMITLAFGVAFYYLVLQNYSLFNGFQGFQKVYPPDVFGLNWREPVPFYFLTLFWAIAGYLAVKWLVRTPFGIALQGVRDNPRRMEALGFNIVAHRVAAYAFGGLLAAIGGVLLVWYNGLITPGSINVGWQINILVIAVLGGMRHPIGAFLGSIVFVLLQTFAIDLIDRERFNLVIGIVFLAIVLFSTDGLLGLWDKLRTRMRHQTSDSVASTRRH